MRDGKALQMGTSHELGQNFAHAFDIAYTDERGELRHGRVDAAARRDHHGPRRRPRPAAAPARGPHQRKARCANGYVDRPLLPSENARLVEEATRLATT